MLFSIILPPDEHKATDENERLNISKESNKSLLHKPIGAGSSQTIPAGFCEKKATAKLKAEEEIGYSTAPPSAGPNFTPHAHIHGLAYFVVRHIHPSSASTLPDRSLFLHLRRGWGVKLCSKSQHIVGLTMFTYCGMKFLLLCELGKEFEKYPD